jgi:hypothetical protein
MDQERRPAPGRTPRSIVCGKDAVTIDRSEAPMCGRHAAIFVTMEHRKQVVKKARIVR